ncbi:retinal guanylyl cyclase 1 [Anguilla anguilla]|uniref:retinal guanylyl cyclase 1 n=1 Tax=Anguilla anguilla TaxID=7936 RepID=UPI0015ACBF7E|nr:retinal guanylyl cyclase 1 [Anguilla anguilla]
MAAHSNSIVLLSVSYHPQWPSGRRRGCPWATENPPPQTNAAPSSGTAVCSGLGTSSRWRSWFWIPMLMVASLPCGTWGATFKVAIVGPWTCDPLFSKAFPDQAARLAISRINRDPYISKGYWYEYILVYEECQTSRALARFADLESYGSAFLGPANPGYCSSAALLGKHWNKAVLSWSCLNPKMDGGMYPTFLRPMPLASHVLFAALRFFRWARVAVVNSRDDLWKATGHELASSLRALGLPVHTVVTMEMDDDNGAREALQKIREADGVRVVIMCMHSVLIGGKAQHMLLTTAVDMRMVDRGYVFIPFDTLLYSLPYKNAEYPALANNTKLSRAYDSVLTITMDSGEKNFYEAFKDAQDSYEIRSRVPPEQVSPFFGTIYNMMYFLAMSVEQSRLSESRWVSGEVLAQSKGGFQFPGFNQPLSAGSNREGMQGRYVVLDTDGKGASLRATHILEAPHTTAEFGGLKYLGRSIHFAGATPSSDSNCWFSTYITCSDGMGSLTLFLIFLLLCLLIGGGAILANIIRRRMPIGIIYGGGGGPSSKVVLTLDDLVFINTQLSRRKLIDDTFAKNNMDDKTPFHSVSGSSYAASTPETSNVAVFEGDWVWLKKFPNAVSMSEVKEDAQTVFIKLRDMRQENLNLYLGLFFDLGVFALVTEYCTRGSLEDLLNNEDVRLDWMFKFSLLMDLIRGMKFLHNRNVLHGRLKSRNCVVDGRFVLKVTDYGCTDILDSQCLSLEEQKPEDLLWTAPEHLRNKADRTGSFAGDVYSFSIIMQEVISRSSPFSTLDMPAKEIIKNVRSPPPLCRPSVSINQAPIDCIQIMKQCWSEEPEKRPTFEEIFKQFKSMNRGKKTNLIDSMLRMLEQYSSNLEDLIRERTEELEVERQKTDRLLAQMLPKSVAQALKTGNPVQPEYFSEVTLYFSDIVGFTTISALSEPIEVVDLLNDLYTLFDAIIGQHDVYKVETIGDAYMVSSGVPNRNGSRHAAEVSNMSLDILHCIGAFQMRHMPDVKVKIRIGLHTGPVVAGVVGLTMPRYCLFGDTVNTASRMESTGLPYRIHVNQNTVDVLHSLNMGYKLDTRGLTELKGKGIENTYWLVGREGFTKPLPVPPDLTPGASNHGISLDEIPPDRRQKFIDRQNKMNKQ